MIDGWRYLQLRHFVEKLPHPIRHGDDYRPLEQLCMRKKSKNNIASIYKIISARDDLEAPPYIKKWENELGSRRNKYTIDKIMKLTHSSAVDIKTIEMNFKCLARWYATPDKISGKSSECWRGCKVAGTMAHFWWNCPIIKKYWKEVLQLIKEITNKEIPEDPWICLFHGVEGSVKQYKASVIPTLINVAKSLIPKKWQEVDSSKIRNWLLGINEIYYLESLDYRWEEEDDGVDRKDKWESWKMFKRRGGT